MEYPAVTDEMCGKCVMRGGVEDPCVSRAALLQIQRDPKRVCPRIDLDGEENLVAAEILWIATRVGADHPLFRHIFDLHTVEMDPESRLILFHRIMAAISDPGIAAKIKAERERALRNRGD